MCRSNISSNEWCSFVLFLFTLMNSCCFHQINMVLIFESWEGWARPWGTRPLCSVLMCAFSFYWFYTHTTLVVLQCPEIHTWMTQIDVLCCISFIKFCRSIESDMVGFLPSNVILLALFNMKSTDSRKSILIVLCFPSSHLNVDGDMSNVWRWWHAWQHTNGAAIVLIH